MVLQRQAVLALFQVGTKKVGEPDMKLLIIEGGKGTPVSAPSETIASLPSAPDVLAEARRRIAGSGYDAQRAREIATGRPVSAAVRYFVLQVQFVADALMRLETIPSDFRSDSYWPVQTEGLKLAH